MSRGNYMKELGMTPRGEIQENTNHTVIFNLRRNLDDWRNELIACRANNNNLKKQLELIGSMGGRKRKKTRRRSRKKRRRSRKKRTKR